MYDLKLLKAHGNCHGNHTNLQFSSAAITVLSSYIADDEAGEAHSHIRGQLIYLMTGSLIVSVKNRSYVVYPGNCIWIPAKIEHTTVARTCSELHSLYIDTTIYASLLSDPWSMEASPLFVALLERYIEQTHSETHQNDTNSSLIGLLVEEIDKGKKVNAGLPLPQDKRLLLLCKNLFENPLCNKTIAELLTDTHISYRHAIRLFKAQTGMDLGKWRIFLKLNISVSLLMSGYSVSQVAYEVGYSNPSGFSTAFKNEFGMPPKEFTGKGVIAGYAAQ